MVHRLTGNIVRQNTTKWGWWKLPAHLDTIMKKWVQGISDMCCVQHKGCYCWQQYLLWCFTLVLVSLNLFIFVFFDFAAFAVEDVEVGKQKKSFVDLHPKRKLTANLKKLIFIHLLCNSCIIVVQYTSLSLLSSVLPLVVYHEIEQTSLCCIGYQHDTRQSLGCCGGAVVFCCFSFGRTPSSANTNGTRCPGISS